MKQTTGRAMLIAGLFLMIAAQPIAAQAPILDFAFETAPVIVPAGGDSFANLHVTNTSVQEADDIEVSLAEGPVTLATVEPIEVLSPFDDVWIRLPLSAGESAEPGESVASFEVLYTYCIGDMCYQILEEISVAIHVAVVGPASDDGDTIPPADTAPAETGVEAWRIVLPIVLGVLLVGTLFASHVRRRHWGVHLMAFVILGTSLGVGFALSQDQQAQSIGAVLCTSCVGIEVTPHVEAVLSADARERITALDEPMELLVFSAPWCHACPYAKQLVAQAADASPVLTVQVIDVDDDRDAADRYGIVQSGRTIVPAILRVDTGEILFGIEDLEERLLSLLGAT